MRKKKRFKPTLGPSLRIVDGPQKDGFWRFDIKNIDVDLAPHTKMDLKMTPRNPLQNLC